MSSVSLVLKGLNCANCANKIEDKVSKLKNVNEANVNFGNSELNILFENTTKIDLISQVTQIVNRLEPDVEVLEKLSSNTIPKTTTTVKKEVATQTGMEKSSKIQLVRLGVGIVIYLLAILGNFAPSVSIALYLAAYLCFGADVVYTALRNLFRGELFDENFLMSLATIGAFAIGDFTEGVAVMLFYQIGEFFQGVAVGRSRRSIKGLMDLKAEYANLVDKNGQTREVDPLEIALGDIIAIKPGEKVPLDGIVLEGKSQIDASSILGESVPRVIQAGDEIQSGTINMNGLLKVEVTKVYKDSTVAKILELVENAGSRKAPAEKFITKFSKVYTPIVVLAAAALAFIPPLVIEGAIFSDWLYRALVFLVISCPCALVVSVPLTFFSGIGAASKKGILIKGSSYLQELTTINTVVMDKTGTLTKGVFEVTNIYPADGVDKNTLLETGYLAELNSNHPIAKSICDYGQKENIIINAERMSQYEEKAGLGISGMIDGKMVLAGNSKLMAENNITSAPFDGLGTIVHVALDNKYLGFIVIADTIKEDSRKAIDSLRKHGVEKIIMLTGDRKESADKVADVLGIDQVYSELMPYEKVEKLEEIYKNSNAKVAFAGDGMNDAPVLARADVGIAMGGVGSAAAIEAADVVLMTDEPSKIAEAIEIAKGTYRIVKQNIAFALLVKAFVLVLGALGKASMWMAVFADVGVTMLVVLNAMRKKSA